MIKNKQCIKFHSKPIYEQEDLKTKVREYDGATKKKTFYVTAYRKKICIILALLALLLILL